MTPMRSRLALADDPVSLEECKSSLEVAWLMTLIVVFLGVAVPWFFRALDIDMGPVAWVLAGFAAVYVAGSRASDNLATSRTVRAAAITLHLLGILTLAGVWHLAGGVGNTPFLIFFALPVLASALMVDRVLPYASALLAAVSVAGVAVAESPGLRWYLERLGVPLGSRLDWFAGGLDRDSASFAESPTLLFVTLIVLTLSLVSVAFVAESLTALLVGLYRRLATSSLAREDAELLYNKLLQGSPDPAAVVLTDSGEIVQASDSFVRDLLLDRSGLAGKTVFELVDFSYPDVVRQALAGGEVPFAVYRVESETRVGQINAWEISHGDTSYTYVVLRDVTDVFNLHTALETIDEPYLLIGPDGRLVYLNGAASRLFGNAEVGEAAEEALSRRADPAKWWEIGLRQLHDREVKVADLVFDASLTASPLPGEDERLTVVRLRLKDWIQ